MFIAGMEVAIGMTVSLHIMHAHVASKEQGGGGARLSHLPLDRHCKVHVCGFFD